MNLTLLIAEVEMSDSPARDKTIPVGVFDDLNQLERAKVVFYKTVAGSRVWFKQVPIEVNQIIRSQAG